MARPKAKPKKADFTKRKMLLMRLGALIKNLEQQPDDTSSIDKYFEQMIMKMEKRLVHMGAIRDYRSARSTMFAKNKPQEIEVVADGNPEAKAKAETPGTAGSREGISVQSVAGLD